MSTEPSSVMQPPKISLPVTVPIPDKEVRARFPKGTPMAKHKYAAKKVLLREIERYNSSEDRNYHYKHPLIHAWTQFATSPTSPWYWSTSKTKHHAEVKEAFKDAMNKEMWMNWDDSESSEGEPVDACSQTPEARA